MSNVDKVIDHILTNSKTLGAEKIKSLALVVRALGGDNKISAPNEVKSETTLLDEEHEMNLDEIDNLEIEGVGTRPVKIYQ